jgi:hypothetical protein
LTLVSIHTGCFYGKEHKPDFSDADEGSLWTIHKKQQETDPELKGGDCVMLENVAQQGYFLGVPPMHNGCFKTKGSYSSSLGRPSADQPMTKNYLALWKLHKVDFTKVQVEVGEAEIQGYKLSSDELAAEVLLEIETSLKEDKAWIGKEMQMDE